MPQFFKKLYIYIYIFKRLQENYTEIPDQQLLGPTSQLSFLKKINKKLVSLGSILIGDPKVFCIKIDSVVRITRKICGLLVRTMAVDGILIETKLKMVS